MFPNVINDNWLMLLLNHEKCTIMIYHVNKNLLEFDKIEAFVHSCNCFCIMGAGIALQIKQKYPELYKADIAFGKRGDHTKLGKFSYAQLHDGKIGYNLYAQYQIGTDHRQTNYEAFYKGLCGIHNHLIQAGVQNIGFPFNIGCKLGGGSWRVISAMIEDVFVDDTTINVYICRYEP